MAIHDKNTLLCGLAAVDIRALAELYDPHAHVAWQAGLNGAHDEVAADAAVNAAFLKLGRRLDRSDPRSLGVRVLTAIRAETLPGDRK